MHKPDCSLTSLMALVLFASSGTQAAQANTSSVSTEVEDIVIKSSRIDLRPEALQTINVGTQVSGTRPTLESALQGQSNIQVTPSPLRGSNLSLNGLSGEHVAIYWDGDPILGRVDGALDTRAVSLGSVDRIAVYQGLDSLPYGSQNIAGVISLESPWEFDRQLQLRSMGGNYGRTVLGAKASGEATRDWYYSLSASNWRGEAIRAGSALGDTATDAMARVSASMLASRRRVGVIGGKDVDVRMGGSGFQDQTRGVLAGEINEGEQRRIHVFTDVRRSTSKFHVSYSDYQNKFRGLGAEGEEARSDTFHERALRIGPELQETYGDLTYFAGALADVHATESSRIPNGKYERTTVGTYAGTRYAVNDSWVVGAGTRWDSGPRLVSPRAELRHLTQSAYFDHTTVLESGLGFREPTPKEMFLEFSNPAIGYRVIGNPELGTERAWMTALRHTIRNKRVTLRASVFQVRVRNTIGFQSGGTESQPAMEYANIGPTLTHGVQWNAEYRFFEGQWHALFGYQWLRGRMLESESDLFLQPRSRISLGLSRDVLSGLSLGAQGVWTGKQGFFDVNRNRKIDAEDWAEAYWMTNFEMGYGFKWSGVAEVVRVFGRVDNVLDLVRPETFPREPRTYLVGASVDL